MKKKKKTKWHGTCCVLVRVYQTNENIFFLLSFAQVLVSSEGLSPPAGAGGPGSNSGSGGGRVSPCYGSNSGSGCCENGRPLVSDPVTGQPVCSCQYDSARLAALSTYPRLTTTAGVYGTPYPSTDQNPYASIETSPFYSTLVSYFFHFLYVFFPTCILFQRALDIDCHSNYRDVGVRCNFDDAR